MAVMWEICAEWRMSTCGSVWVPLLHKIPGLQLRIAIEKNFQLSNLISPFLWDICASCTVFENRKKNQLMAPNQIQISNGYQDEKVLVNPITSYFL